MSDLLTRLRIEATTTQAVAEIDQTAKSMDGLKASSAAASPEVRGAGQELAQLAVKTGVTRAQFQELTAIARHSFDALAAGSPVTTVLTTHIASLAEVAGLSKGGLGGALSLLSGLFSPVVVGIGLTAAAAAVGAKAYLDNDAAARKLQISSEYLGSTSGLTAQQLEASAERGAKASNTSVASARGLAAEYVSSGKIGGEALTGLIGLTADYASITGEKAPDAAKALATAIGEPTKGLKLFNDQLSLLDAAQTRHIEQLIAEGHETEAQDAIVKALGDRIHGAANETAGWAKVWNTVTTAASNAYTAIGKAVGRVVNGAPVDEQIAGLQARLANPNSVALGDDQTALHARLLKLQIQKGLTDSVTARAVYDKKDVGLKDAITRANPKAAQDDADRGLITQLTEGLKDPGTNSPDAIRAAIKAAQDRIAKRGPTAGPKGSSANPDQAAINQDHSLASQVADQEAYRQALDATGVALDQVKIKQAGDKAVEESHLSTKASLTEAEKTLVGSIRSHAEQLEALKLANQRVEAAHGISETAQRDTAALKAEAEAVAGGTQAIEDYQVAQAGAKAMAQLHIQTLDQLTGSDRAAAEAAIADAEARERQAIATGKAKAVASTVDDITRSADAERRHALAIAEGTDAEIDYARAELERQYVEAAGKNLTAEQTALIKKKADALFALKSASSAVQVDADGSKALANAVLTNREREVEARTLQLATSLKERGLVATVEEGTAAARVQAIHEQDAKDLAASIGGLRESLRQEFIDDGKLGFDKVGEYAEKRLRQAVYDSLLAKPFDVVVNATVNVLTQALAGLGLGGGYTGADDKLNLNQALGQLGIGSNAAGIFAGIPGLSSLASSGLLKQLGGGAVAGGLVSGLAGLVGVKQTGASQIGSTIGGIAGSFLPIPGGSFIGAAVGDLLGSIFNGKSSNNAAVVTLDQAGAVTSLGGGKRTDQTTDSVQKVAASLATLEGQLRAAGATLGATVQSIDLGVRDTTHTILSDGQRIETAAGDMDAAVKAASAAIVKGATFGSEAQTAYAQKLIAAGTSLDDVVAKLQSATALASQVDDAILQFTDPEAYAKKAALDTVDASYASLKAQAQALIDNGLAGADLLSKIDKLHGLQTQDALKKLADAASGAAGSLDAVKAADNPFDDVRDSLQQWIDKVATGSSSELNPDEQRGQAYASYERQVELARGGNADALGSITDYADRVLSADRQATDSAQDRLALYNKVTGDIQGLAAIDRVDPVVTALETLTSAVGLGDASIVSAIGEGSTSVEPGDLSIVDAINASAASTTTSDAIVSAIGEGSTSVEPGDLSIVDAINASAASTTTSDAIVTALTTNAASQVTTGGLDELASSIVSQVARLAPDPSIFASAIKDLNDNVVGSLVSLSDLSWKQLQRLQAVQDGMDGNNALLRLAAL